MSATPSTAVEATPSRMPPKGGQAMRLVQATGQPVGIQARGETGVGGRAVPILLHVVFARPGELHGRAHGFRNLDGFADVIGAGAASESAAHIEGMHLDGVGRQAGNVDGRLQRRGLALRGGPDFAAIRRARRRCS